MNPLTITVGAIGVAVFTMLVLGIVLSRLYRRASKEHSFVRTGFGGQKVIMDGGALLLPVLHELIKVNMKTLPLEVDRSNEQALITKDRMRVDVKAQFYVRVKPTVDAIATAAQTLGERTMEPALLKILVEGKFVDALRAVAAMMEMTELHEKRGDFVQMVQNAVSGDLKKNGLELESVSLTALDQTDKDFFNPNNAFDAQGLTKLTEQIEQRRKERNDFEQDSEVAIRLKNLEAERQKLNIHREDEYARMEQEREVETRRAEQEAQVATERAERKREAEEAGIVSKRQVELSEIEAQRQVEERRLAKDQFVRERDIEKQRAVETAEIERLKTVELTEQDRAIAIAEKSKQQSEAEAVADVARALAVKASEEVVTSRELAKAEREKGVKLVKARETAEERAIDVLVRADAEMKAAVDQATAVRTIAQAEADRLRIAADGEAQAIRLKAEAAEVQYRVDAEGTEALHRAENVLTPEIIALRIKLSLIEHLPQIVAESVRPLENIDGIKILQVDGLGGLGGGGGNGGGGNDGGGGGGGSMSDQLVNAALRYRGQAPLVDKVLGELGLAGGDITSLLPSSLDDFNAGLPETASVPPEPVAPEAPKASGPPKVLAPKTRPASRPVTTPSPPSQDLLPTDADQPELDPEG